jgi:hypothetical protein
VLSEVCGFSGGNMGRAADLQETQVCATHYMHNNPVARGLGAQPGDRPWSGRGGAILLPERQFRFGDGSDAVNGRWRRLAPQHQGRRHTRQCLPYPRGSRGYKFPARKAVKVSIRAQIRTWLTL